MENSFSFPGKIGLFAGPLFFLVILIAGPSADSVKVIALAAWMITWWVTEAVPIPVTALLPMILFPLLGLFSIQESTAPYASPIVFLFMGGFIIAIGLEKHNLHTRIALNLVRLTGSKANGIILGFMIATAFLSMWISNTATTVMMLPIAISVISLIEDNDPKIKGTKGYRLFALGLLLSIAYAANIGGTATIIGTPPNVVLVGYIKQFYNIDLEFSRWLLIGLPISITLIGITFLLITRVIFPNRLGKISGSEELVKNQLKKLGTYSKEEKLVTVVFASTAAGWIFRQPLNNLIGANLLNDTLIAMSGGLLMFLVPVNFRKGQFILNWKDMKRLPWGILILFGGGLTLAKGMESSGIIQQIGDAFSQGSALNYTMLLILLTAVMLFMTELMSNVALTTIFVPVVLGIANGIEIEPLYLAIPVTLASSCAFMMPISTPPNAIVFSSGHIHMRDMMKIGFWLNLVSIVILSIAGITLIKWVY